MLIIVFTMILIVATMIYIVFAKIGNVLKHLKYVWVNCYIISYIKGITKKKLESSSIIISSYNGPKRGFAPKLHHFQHQQSSFLQNIRGCRTRATASDDFEP